jgi:TetR/AcrR family transcriptional repressor of mexJK operon
MSKKTLYGFFDSKESLFAAVIAARRESMPAGDLPPDVADIESIEGVLLNYVGSFARFVHAPRQDALYRLVISEAHRAPDLSRAFYREGPERARAPMAAWLKSLNRLGLLKIADPVTTAAMLIAMAIAELHMRVLMMGAGETISEVEIDRYVGEAIRTFLAGAAIYPTDIKVADRNGANVLPAK